MSLKVFLQTANGAVPAVVAPEWATHIIRRRLDGVLFFARNPKGKSEFYTGEEIGRAHV